MPTNEQVREGVSRAYAEAVRAPAGGCCRSEQKGVTVKVAGYKAEELDALPDDAVVNSFGCGNPLAFGRVVEGDVVLDLGCGAGIDLLIARGKVGPSGHVIGVDMTDEMLDRARQNIAASGCDNVEVRKGLIEGLPVESGTVDWVISNCVINLSPDKEKVFAEIARVLKPGGHMLVSDLVADDLPDEIRRSESLHHCCIAGAVSETDYVAGLRRAGMGEIEVRQRIEYDVSQIESLVRSEATEGAACGCCEGGATPREVAEAIRGKIWSAQFVARKPVTTTKAVHLTETTHRHSEGA